VSLPVAALVGLLGGVGAIARFVLDGALGARLRSGFPYGTFVVNLLGSFGLGLLIGVALTGNGYRLLGTGLIGAFTTFSTWTLESHRLAEDGELALCVMNFVLSLVLGLAAAWAGRHVGAWL
jgi:fluoride exporter